MAPLDSYFVGRGLEALEDRLVRFESVGESVALVLEIRNSVFEFGDAYREPVVSCAELAEFREDVLEGQSGV